MEFSDAGLVGLFVSAFVSATVLPGNSEIVLAAFVKAFPAHAAAAIAMAAGKLARYAALAWALARL